MSQLAAGASGAEATAYFEEGPEAELEAPSFALYSHDSYGLGHLRRNLTLAHSFRARWPRAAQLMVSGTPLTQACVPPDGADCLKLPAVVKVGDGDYASRTLPLSFQTIRDLRRDVILSAVRRFHPDVFLVDHAPAGLEGELVPALYHLKRAAPRTRLVLGLRDIIDEAKRVRRTWAREGIHELLDDVYDLILVYGERDLYDAVGEYGFSPKAAAKTRYTGYLRASPPARAPEELRAELRLQTGRLVLATAGGGGDGYRLLKTAIHAQRLRSGGQAFDLLLVGGPLMPDERLRGLADLIPAGGAVRMTEFLADMASHVAAADVVVSMGGYNSVCELISLERPAIVVPRVDPRKEQLIRAELLSRRGLVEMIHPAELTPLALREGIDELLGGGQRRGSRLNLDGLSTVGNLFEELLAVGRPGANGSDPTRRARLRRRLSVRA